MQTAGTNIPLHEQLASAGLQVAGWCDRLSSLGPQLLESSALLRDFTAAEVDILGAGMLLVRAAPGQVLIQEGDTGEWMMLVLKGTVDITKRVPAPLNAAPGDAPAGEAVKADEASAAVEPVDADQAGTVSRLSVVRAGAALGEMSMLDSEPRYASCTAIDEVEAAAIGRYEIALLIRDHPGVGAKLLVKITQLMAQRLRNASNQLVRRMHPR